MVEESVVILGITFYSLGIIVCVINLIAVNVKAKIEDRT